MKTINNIELFKRGIDRIHEFSVVNNINPIDILQIPKNRWKFNYCGYYRNNKIHVCIEKCARTAVDLQYRNWNWPGSTVDREPFGVISHEFSHFLDEISSGKEGKWYSSLVRMESKEPKLTNYCPNDSEWFAEMGRLFITNHALLKEVRPRTWNILTRKWKPVSKPNWIEELGEGIPERIITSLENKIKNQNLLFRIPQKLNPNNHS